MNLFYPSTKRYYIDYFSHPDYVDSKSFLVLNFAWKFSNPSPFHYKFRSKFRKVIRYTADLQPQLDSFKPQFFLDKLNSTNFFPIFFFNSKIRLILNDYLLNLTFLVNIFTKNTGLVSLTLDRVGYLFSYLANSGLLITDKKRFFEICLLNSSISYSKFFDLLNNNLFLSKTDLLLHRERTVAEYIAFKRFYSLLISEYGNMR